MRPFVHLLTGFLGSGKTTLLNRLLRQPEMAPSAVLINEFGPVGIDHLIIEALDEEIVLLESGCVCCRVRDEFTASLENLNKKRIAGHIPPFEQVVLETSGIADPMSIVEAMMADKSICRTFRIGNTITVVDSVYCLQQLEAHLETREQIAFADSIVLSKCDLAGVNLVEAAKAAVRVINPLVPVLDARELQLVTLFGAPEGDGTANVPEHLQESVLTSLNTDQIPRTSHLAHVYNTFSISWKEPVRWKDIEDWLSGLLFARGDDILRIKGVLHICEQSCPVLIQGVRQSLYEPVQLQIWPRGIPHTDLVFVTRHFSRSAAITSLKPFIEYQLTASA